MTLQDKIKEVCAGSSEYIQGLCDNHDLIKIAKTVTRGFYRLSDEDKENCILLAIWKCINNYDPDKESKSSFTSYLYRGVEIECLTITNFNKKRGYCGTFLNKDVIAPDNFEEHIDLVDEIQNDENYDILYDRFFLDIPIKDIATKNNCSYESIRGKIKQSISRMRINLAECV